MRDGLTDHVNQAAMVGMGEWEVNERSSPAVAGRNQGETRAVLPLSDFYTGSPESLVCPHAETTLSTPRCGLAFYPNLQKGWLAGVRKCSDHTPSDTGLLEIKSLLRTGAYLCAYADLRCSTIHPRYVASGTSSKTQCDRASNTSNLYLPST